MGQGRILIVDDEISVLHTLTELLHNNGFDVSSASNGHEALQLIQSCTPDVVLLDIWLPGMDGIETLQALREVRTNVPVVIISGHASVEAAVKVTKLGAFDYLEKPLSAERVLSTVHRAFDRYHPHLSQRRSAQHFPPVLIGTSQHINQIRRRLSEAWHDDTVVTIQGERGSGKTLVARLIHNGSARREGPFIISRCASLSAITAASLLFGDIRETGQWHGSPSKGYLELANGGTLFLDQIESLPLETQRQLAQALASKSMQRVKGTIPIPLNVRVIASSLASLERLQAEGTLCPALASQLQGLAWELAPLRQHAEDIPALVRYFLQVFAREYGIPDKKITDAAMQDLMTHPWPENVTDLKRLMEQLVLTTSTDCIDVQALSGHGRDGQAVLSTGENGSGLSHPGIQQWRDILRPNGHAPQSIPYNNQRTLRRSMVLYGQGLQSGLKTGIILSPLPPNSGILFRNITTGGTFPGSVDFVTSTDFCTSLCTGRFNARTVEHLLSSLHAYRITNLLVKISDEVPIMDGSAMDFCQLIEEGGILEQEVPAEEFVVDQCYSVGHVSTDDKFILVEPYDGLRVTYRLHYPPPLGIQEFVYEHTGSESYAKDIAPARTFAFVKEVEKMHQLGLIGGGRLNNVILIDDEKIVNSFPLRFPNEFVRHKILDILGDLYLLGRPIRGHVQANMTGHTENVALVKKLRDIIQHDTPKVW